jgi:hypothetical protein
MAYTLLVILGLIHVLDLFQTLYKVHDFLGMLVGQVPVDWMGCYIIVGHFVY